MSETTAGAVVFSILWRGVQSSVPLLLAANGELVGQRAGLLNIGIEGAMLSGACAAAIMGWWTGSAFLGVVGGAAAGTVVGAVFACWTVIARRDQIVAGLGLNLLALGLTGVAVQHADAWAASRGVRVLPPPLAGSGGVDWLLPTSLGMIALTHLLLGRSRIGLALRAVGENPAAAEAAGVRVLVVRTAAALFASMMAGLGGAYLSLEIASGFQEQMTAGRGFLALSLVIFGRWSAPGVLAAALFFGCLDSVQVALQPALGRHVHVLYPALLALPYVLALAALAGLAGRVRPPAALAVPYDGA